MSRHIVLAAATLYTTSSKTILRQAQDGVVTDASGNPITGGEQRYYPYGETRLTATMLTDKLFTSQRDTGLGIYDYRARFYSPKTGRFISPDTIIPGYTNPQNLNRFSYVRNNPVRYTDPAGHADWNEDDGGVYCSEPPCTPPPCSTCGGGTTVGTY